MMDVLAFELKNELQCGFMDYNVVKYDDFLTKLAKSTSLDPYR